MILLSASKVCFGVQRDGGISSFLAMLHMKVCWKSKGGGLGV